MPVPDAPRAVKRELLRDSAYAALRDAIVGGTLEPGEHLHDDELCAWLGLSRTPVRDALRQLAADGLVESVPQRFTRVTVCSAGDARHAFPLVAALHALATELAVPHLGGDDLAALHAAQTAFVRALRAGEATQAYDADDRFHQIFVERAANPQLSLTLERMLPLLHRMELLADRSPGRTAVAQHRAIIERATAGQAAAAASAARENWLAMGALVERELARAASH